MLELHRKILGDHGRNQAFYNALQRTVCPGTSTVCDVGAGTGLLAFMASRLGAKECVLIEHSPIMEIARSTAVANGIENCRFIDQHSTTYQGSIAADILVSETLGNYALEENILESLEDAKRFLKPGGIIIPGSIDQYVVPVTSARLYDALNVWDGIGFGLDFSVAKRAALNNMFVKSITSSDLLQSAQAVQRWDHIDFARRNERVRQKTVNWTMEQSVTIYGFALWWKALLVPGVELSTSPYDAQTHWEQIYLPIVSPLSVQQGQTLRLDLASDTQLEVKVNLTWDTSVWTAEGRPVTAVHMDMQDGL